MAAYRGSSIHIFENSKACNAIIVNKGEIICYLQQVTPMLSEDAGKQLEKAWINLYGNKLNDGQVCRLAAKHNIENTGSRQTKWLERVTTC